VKNKHIEKLSPQMREKAIKFVEKCSERGVTVLIYCTTRSLERQARLFRQGRTHLQIKDRMYKLRKRGFGFLAEIIDKVGPQRGSKIVTGAGPGESFHNYAEAFDAVPLNSSGKCIWDHKANPEPWETMWEVGEELGLNVGGRWKWFDGPHFQLRKGSNPTRIYTPEKLREILIKNKLLKE